MLTQTQESNENFKNEIIPIFSSLFQSTKTTKFDVLKIQKEGAELAVKHGKIYNYNLNYSDSSIKNVDKILTRLSQEYSIKENKSELKGLAMIFGLYIIEVFERNHEKGYLERRLLGLETDDFPYSWNGKLIFPCNWCLKKIFDEKANDVWEMYNVTLSKTN